MKKILFTIFATISLVELFAQFADPVILDPANSGITQVCTGDINNDGLQDIIVSKAYSSNRISYYLNEGDLTFGVEQIVTDAYHFYQVVASSDFNSDGFDDIVTFGRGAENNITDLKLFINDSGNFSSPVSLDTDLIADNQVSCSDIDNDGDIDIIADDDITIRLYRNDGNANFSPPVIIANNDEYYTFDISDFNGDGNKDIVLAGAGNITILWNDTQGTFPTFSYVDNPLFGLPFTVKAGDFDNDGDNDFALWIAWIDKLVWFSNDGEGNFSIAQEIEAISLNITLEASDVDLDGDLDLVTSTNQSGSVIWYENDGSGIFSEHSIIYQFSGFESVESVFPADMDNDGDEDLVWGAASNFLAISENMAITVSIDDFPADNKTSFDIYPNPASGYVTIEFDDDTEKELIISDIAGNIIIKRTVFESGCSIDVSSLKNGVYFVELRTSDGSENIEPGPKSLFGAKLFVNKNY